MKLKMMMLACTALTAAALVAPAVAKSDTVTLSREQYEAIMNRLERLEKTGAPAAGGNAQLEQRVQDLEISQGAKINALQQRADAVPPGLARKENEAERAKARYQANAADVQAFYRTNRYGS